MMAIGTMFDILHEHSLPQSEPLFKESPMQRGHIENTSSRPFESPHAPVLIFKAAGSLVAVLVAPDDLETAVWDINDPQNCNVSE